MVTFNIDIKQTLLCILLLALTVMVVYLIVLAANLIKTVKETNKILADAAVVSEIIAEKAKELNAVVDDVQSAVADLSQAVKGQQNLVGAVSNIVKAFGSLAAIFRKESGAEPAGKKVKK